MAGAGKPGGASGQALGCDSGIPMLTSPVSPAEKHERGRLAEYLHDDVCQFLSLAQIKLSMFKQTENDDERSRLAASAEELVRRANRSVRAMMLQMIHSRTHEPVYVGAAEWVVQDIEQLYELSVRLHDDGPSMGVQTRIVLLQCLRELLVNVAKHAHTDEATVTIRRNRGTVQLTVADKGHGFNREPLVAERSAGGFGLSSIRERIEDLSGTMDVQSAPGQGTTVTIEVPADDEGK